MGTFCFLSQATQEEQVHIGRDNDSVPVIISSAPVPTSLLLKSSPALDNTSKLAGEIVSSETDDKSCLVEI